MMPGDVEEEETEEEMHARVEREERARIMRLEEEDEAQQMGIAPRGRGMGEDLFTVAKRFGLLGVAAFGGSSAHVALLQSQTWR